MSFNNIVVSNAYVEKINPSRFDKVAKYYAYSVAKNALGEDVRTYTEAASVGTEANILATYSIDSTWTDGQLTDYKVTKI